MSVATEKTSEMAADWLQDGRREVLVDFAKSSFREVMEQKSDWSRSKCEWLVLKYREDKLNPSTNKSEIAHEMSGPNITVLFELVKRVWKVLWSDNKVRSEGIN